MRQDPRKVGEIWFSDYWRLRYEVLACETVGSDRWFVVRWEDGQTTTHCTALGKNDHRIS